MRRLGARFGLGLVTLLVGALILVELLANVHLPIFRMVIAIAIVLIGGRMIIESWMRRQAQAAAGEAVLADLDFLQAGTLEHDTRFDVVLARGTIDLTRLVEPAHDVTVTIDTLFGRSVVKLPTALAYDIEGSATFGQLRMPDRIAGATPTTTIMGSVEYRAPSDHPPRVHLRVHAAFGACRVIEEAASAAPRAG